MKHKTYSCRKISPGRITAPAVCSSEEILFYHADPATGVINETGHCLVGKSVAGAVVVFPGGKGSSVVQADGLYNLEQSGKAPAGFIVRYLDTVLVSTAVIMEIPMVWKAEEAFWDCIRDGDMVELDADKETVTIRAGQQDGMESPGMRKG